MSVGMSHLNLYNWQIAVFVCAVGALILFSFIANVLVVYTITHTPWLNIPSNCSVISLAIGNMLESVIVMPVSAYINLVGANSERCKLWNVALSVCVQITIFSHVTIVVDRYIAISSYRYERIVQSLVPDGPTISVEKVALFCNPA
jgi:hypothetical protein